MRVSACIGFGLDAKGAGLDETDERQLIARAQAGDANAYEALVRRYQTLAFRTAWLVTGERATAEDATQNAFLKAWQSIDRFSLARVHDAEATETPFRPWLLQIVANEARNRLRAERGHPLIELDDAPDHSDRSLEGAPEELTLARETHLALADALNRLSSEDRQVIAMRYLLDLTEREMAAALGVAPGTVKSRLFRALRRARAILVADGTERSAHDG